MGENEELMLDIAHGVADAVRHCKFHLRKNRWNCPTISDRRLKSKKKPMKHLLGGALKYSSREAAFVHSLVSAGVAYKIAKKCTDEDYYHHSICSCGSNKNTVLPPTVTIHGKNSDSYMSNSDRLECQIKAGVDYARRFVDEPDSKQLARNVMNRHNNNVGRMAILENMETKCRCHGISGSCVENSCWKVMPKFLTVTTILKEKYMKAVAMKIKKRQEARGIVEELVLRHKKVIRPDETELIFYEKSPDYCQYDSRTGIVGTTGRRCNATSGDIDDCSLLCCGRGYHEGSELKSKDCRCKLTWCCQYNCDKCEVENTIYRCK